MNEGLTVFLGGAGMNGSYQDDVLASLRQAGIKNVVYGNYSGWFKGIDKKIPSSLDTLGDASAVVFYNQDESDPIALQLVNTNDCKLEGRHSSLGLVLHKYSGINSEGKGCEKYVIRYELDTPRSTEFHLQRLDIYKTPPKGGQFNIIGYSWGAVISARTALYYARKNIKVHNLVLIGAPINRSLLLAVKSASNIENVIVINLQQYGDPIYAGMSDVELIQHIPTLASQMAAGEGDGHFYYAVSNEIGNSRRQMLAINLFNKGLR